MARERNLNNLKTEKEDIQMLRELIPNFFVPSKEKRIFIYQKLGIDYRKYSRSIDGIILNVKSISDINSKNDIDLIEIKPLKQKI